MRPSAGPAGGAYRAHEAAFAGPVARCVDDAILTRLGKRIEAGQNDDGCKPCKTFHETPPQVLDVILCPGAIAPENIGVAAAIEIPGADQNERDARRRQDAI